MKGEAVSRPHPAPTGDMVVDVFFGRADVSVEIPSSYVPIVERLIAEGKFQSEEEVVAEGLRLIVLREELERDVQAGLDDLDAGNRVEASQVYAEARSRIKAVEDQARP